MKETSQKTGIVTVSIVSHGQMELVAPLLEQLAHHCLSSIGKVVLTLNIPEPKTLAIEIAATPFDLEIVCNVQPLGFGSNHNQAFLRCETPWFLVLNPDIRISDDVLSALLAITKPGSGIMAPRILEPGRNETEPHRALLTPREILTRRQPGYRAPVEPVWIPGLFMLFRSDTFRQVAGFDKRFFMYGEDFDICARTRLAGWNVQIGESLQVRHEAQRESHRSWRAMGWHIESLLRVWTSSAFWRLQKQLRRP